MAKIEAEGEAYAIRVIRDIGLQDDKPGMVEEIFDEQETRRVGSLEDSAEENHNEYKEVSSVLVDNVPHTTVEALGVAKDAILVKDDGVFVSDYNGEILAMAFHLFPFGRGHPGCSREVPVSFEECCRYYMRLSGRTFTQHRTFGLVVFNLCGKRRVATSTSVRARFTPEQFAGIGTVTRDELAMALLERRKRRENSLAGRASTGERGPVRTKAEILLRNIRVSQANMWGSAAERLVYRRRALSMDAVMKSGAVFVTLIPTDVGTIHICVIAGEMSKEEVENMRRCGGMPSRAKRVKLSGMDPSACSENFETVCEVFFDDIVRFDRQRGLSKKGGGLFGVVKAYVGAVECQNNGTLHLHAILFVTGLPGTCSSFVQRCEEPGKGKAFQSSFTALVDRTISNSIPSHIIPGKRPAFPGCGQESSLSHLREISDEAFTRLNKYRKPPHIAVCNFCGAGYGVCEVIRAEVRGLYKSLDGTEYAQSRIPMVGSDRGCDEETEKRCLFLRNTTTPGGWVSQEEGGTSPRERAHRLRLCQILLLTQQHNYKHVPSCFKSSTSSKSGHCRYGFPRRAHEHTEVDENYDLIVARKEHNEYINTCNDVLMFLLRSNNDVKFLVRRGTADAFYYTMKYVTKVSNELEGLESVIMACFEKRAVVERGRDKLGLGQALTSKGRARVNSMAIALSKTFSVATTLCSIYMRRKSARYSSHDFVPFLLGHIMSAVRSSEHEAAFEKAGNGEYVGVTQYIDFMYRPVPLRNLSLAQYLSRMKRVKRRERQIEELRTISCDEYGQQGIETQFQLHENHPQAGSHVVKEGSVRFIPDIIGPRIPDRTALPTEHLKEQCGLIALILCFPFHPGRPIKQPNKSYWDMLVHCENHYLIEAEDQKILRNLQESHESKRETERERDRLQESTRRFGKHSNDNDPQDEVDEVFDAHEVTDDEEVCDDEIGETAAATASRGWQTVDLCVFFQTRNL